MLDDALGGDQGDKVGGGFLDDGEAGALQRADQHGFAGARGAGEDVALHWGLRPADGAVGSAIRPLTRG